MVPSLFNGVHTNAAHHGNKGGYWGTQHLVTFYEPRDTTMDKAGVLPAMLWVLWVHKERLLKEESLVERRFDIQESYNDLLL